MNISVVDVVKIPVTAVGGASGIKDLKAVLITAPSEKELLDS